MEFLADNYGYTIWFSVILAYCLLYLVGKGAYEWRWSHWVALTAVFSPVFTVVAWLVIGVTRVWRLAPGFFGRWDLEIAFGAGIVFSALCVHWLRKRPFWQNAAKLVCLPILLWLLAYALMFLISERYFSYGLAGVRYYDVNSAALFLMAVFLSFLGAVVACGRSIRALVWVCLVNTVMPLLGMLLNT